MESSVILFYMRREKRWKTEIIFLTMRKGADICCCSGAYIGVRFDGDCAGSIYCDIQCAHAAFCADIGIFCAVQCGKNIEKTDCSVPCYPACLHNFCKHFDIGGKEYEFFSKLDRGKCKAVLIGCAVLLFVISPMVDYRWLYGSYSYSQIGYGPVHRFAGYVIGVAMSLCILKLMSREKSFVSEIGKKSMYIYLGHAPGVALFKILSEKI